MYYWFYYSTHSGSATKTFSKSEVEYQLKPIEVNSQQNAPGKLFQEFRQPGTLHIEDLLRHIKIPSRQQKVALPYKDGYEFVEVSHIIYCQAEGAYTKVFLDNRKYILVSKTLRGIEELLPKDMFQRIHHSTVVNLGFITHFVKSDGGYLKLRTGEQLPVSKSKKEGLLEQLGLK